MQLNHRPVAGNDIQVICGYPQNEDELFYMFPKATFPLSVAQLQEAIASRSDSTVVELEGEVVAFANFYQWQVAGRCAIGNVIVSPLVRGRGVGRYLIETMIAIAATKYQAKEIAVSCFSQNVAGLLLYPKLGFRPYAIEARKNINNESVVLIHLHLLRSAT